MKVTTRSSLGQLSDMDIRLLRVFKSVVECGGMAAAELELNIGISTMSRHVKDLETRLGMTLCRRGRSGFALTIEGQKIYTEVLRLLAGADAFRQSVNEIHRRMGGQISIAVFDKTVSNPVAHIHEAIALFSELAPEVSLHMHVAPINVIERGVIDGQFQVGVIPGHRNSKTLAYEALFDETMLLYCGANHELFEAETADLGWNDLHRHQFAGLGYHSPNMEISQKVGLPRMATGYDQESIATLILSGKYLGFLPNHYAQGFMHFEQMRPVNAGLFRYECNFFSIVRRSPQPSKVTAAFNDCLLRAHQSISG